MGLTRSAAPAIDIQGRQTSSVQGRKGSGVVMVLLGVEISLDRLRITPLKTKIELPRVCSAANRTVADRLAAVDDALETLLLRRA